MKALMQKTRIDMYRIIHTFKLPSILQLIIKTKFYTQNESLFLEGKLLYDADASVMDCTIQESASLELLDRQIPR